MKHLLTFLGTAVATIVIFYLLGGVCWILAEISELFVFNCTFEFVVEDIGDFLWIFSSSWPVGSTVVAVIFWIVSWIFIETIS
jgi:hypothetical protein